MTTREHYIECLEANIQRISDERKTCTHDLDKGGRLEELQFEYEGLLKEVRDAATDQLATVVMVTDKLSGGATTESGWMDSERKESSAPALANENCKQTASKPGNLVTFLVHFVTFRLLGP